MWISYGNLIPLLKARIKSAQALMRLHEKNYSLTNYYHFVFMYAGDIRNTRNTSWYVWPYLHLHLINSLWIGSFHPHQTSSFIFLSFSLWLTAKSNILYLKVFLSIISDCVVPAATKVRFYCRNPFNYLNYTRVTLRNWQRHKLSSTSRLAESTTPSWDFLMNWWCYCS